MFPTNACFQKYNEKDRSMIHTLYLKLFLLLVTDLRLDLREEFKQII